MWHRFVAKYKRVLVQFGTIADYDVPTNFYCLSEQAEIRGLYIDGLGVTVDAHNHLLARILSVDVFNISTDEFLQFPESELTSILGSHVGYCPFASVQ
jgi:predicted GNAT superfamily acetyltransferase